MKLTKAICPICEEGSLIRKVSKEIQIYKKISRELNMFYSQCDCCGSETATSEELRLNKKEMIKFQKSIDGLLSSAEIKEIRKLLGLTIKLAGQIFGGGPVAFSKYENDDLVQSLSMDSALRLAKINPESIFQLAKERGVKLSQPAIPPLIMLTPNSHTVSVTISGDFDNQRDLNTIPVNFESSPPSNFVEVYNRVQ